MFHLNNLEKKYPIDAKIPTTTIITNGAIYQPTVNKMPVKTISIIYPSLIVHLSTLHIGGLTPSSTTPELGYTLPLFHNHLGLDSYIFYSSPTSIFLIRLQYDSKSISVSTCLGLTAYRANLIAI